MSTPSLRKTMGVIYVIYLQYNHGIRVRGFTVASSDHDVVMVGSLICCGSCTSWRVALPSKPSSATCSLWNFVLRQSKPLQIESYLPAGLEISICSRYYILCFSAIDYRRCFAFNFFYQLSSLLCLLLTFYRLVESLNFTFVRVESAQWHGLPKLTSFRFSYAILLFIILS